MRKLPDNPVIMPGPFQDWENYPFNFSGGQIHMDDTKHFHEELESRAGDLFVSDSSKTRVEVLDGLPGKAKLRTYLNYLSSQLTALERKVAYPKERKGHYEIDISQSQDLQLLRRKLFSVLFIIKSTLATIETIHSESETLGKHVEIEPTLQLSFQLELKYIANDLKSHLNTVEKLLLFSEDIRQLSHKMLELVGQELLHENGLNLERIAVADAEDKKARAFFSTGLVQWDQGNSGLKIRPEIWIALVTTIVLALGTLSMATFWDRRGRDMTVEENV
ncbi:hypothetical protein G7Y89_g12040 [Cudoniella acicularis]|uniref:Uncharacterized protein n=1 Tax=Cudoniella acicularis TaxID=354080 RepID=A0A8H4RBZ8_9HELO|nr:hypothetical protein G7Y89_g12040 [Cudoniella acicularis]